MSKAVSLWLPGRQDIIEAAFASEEGLWMTLGLMHGEEPLALKHLLLSKGAKVVRVDISVVEE